MAKKYLAAVKDIEVWAFPSKKDRDGFIADIKKRWPDIEYATSEINE